MFRFKFKRNGNLMRYEIGSLLEIGDRVASFQISIIFTFFAD